MIRITAACGCVSIGAYAILAALTGLARSDLWETVLLVDALIALALAALWTLTPVMRSGGPAIAFVCLADIAIAAGLMAIADTQLASFGCAVFCTIGIFACFYVPKSTFVGHVLFVGTFIGVVVSYAPISSVTVIALCINVWILIAVPIVIRWLWVDSERYVIMAFRDSLTGCANRAGLYVTFFSVEAFAKREHLNIAVLLADIDQFKRVNDEFGHAVGDATIADTVAHLVRHFDRLAIVCRYGGEEFAVVAVGHKSDLISTMKTFATETDGQGVSPGVTLSVGIAWCDYSSHAGESLRIAVAAADRAMYAAKRAGGNRIVSLLEN